MDEHLYFNECANKLCDCRKSVSKINVISKFKTFKIISFQTCTKLYVSCVWPIMDYCGSIWAHGKYNLADQIQNIAICYFLGVHHNAPILAVQAEMGWILQKYKFNMSSMRQ